MAEEKPVGRRMGVGYVKSDKATIWESGNAESTEVEFLDSAFAEFDTIDARIVAYQKETEKLGIETREILSEIGEIVARLRAG